MKHDFGIIDSFEENKRYSDYEPKKIIVFLSMMNRYPDPDIVKSHAIRGI